MKKIEQKYMGQTKILIDWARFFNIKPGTLYYRIRKGKPFLESIVFPSPSVKKTKRDCKNKKCKKNFNPTRVSQIFCCRKCFKAVWYINNKHLWKKK